MLRSVAEAHAGPPVALALQGEHRVRTDLERPGHPPGEMHPQERVARVGNRVDHAAHQLAFRLAHRHVFASERHDPGTVRAVGEAGEPVGLQSGTDDESVDPARTGGGAHLDGSDPRPHPCDTRTDEDAPAGRLDVLGDRLGDRDVVGDGGRRRTQGRQAERVRLDLGDLGRRRRASGPAPDSRWRSSPGRPTGRARCPRRPPPACRTRRTGARAQHSSPSAAGGLVCTAPPSGCLACSRYRRVRRRSCGRSGARRDGPPSRTR